MKVSVETVTPEKAAKWLALNDHNRPLKKEVVTRLAGAIMRGEWQLNGETIKLNGKRLIDGQHRLAAIVQADRPVQSVVAYEVTEDAQETVDLGVRRSLADILKLRGYTDATAIAAALVQLYFWRTEGRIGITRGGKYPTVQQMLRLLDEEPGIADSLPLVGRVRHRLRYPLAIGVVLHYLMRQIDAEDADTFWDRLVTGVGLHEDDPIYLLRRFIEDEPMQGLRSPKVKIAALTIKSWNFWRQGDKPQRLRFRMGGARPDDFPVPA